MHLQVATSGETVGGSRYRTLGRLGAGGMAEVDLALQTGVAGAARLCVLKRVRRDLAGRQEFVSMFFDEARISASLNHPNIVQIYEVGGDEQDCFLAMEFLRGLSYAHVQHNSPGGVLDFRVDLEVMIATLNGLEHAHERRDLSGQPLRLVHRDISPPNVFVSYEGEIKLLDFGVAKSKDSFVQTEAGILKGKVGYMAPELVANEPLDARADLYAVGVMLWEATALHDRWPGMSDVAILAQLARCSAPEPPGAVQRGLPALVDIICVKALAPDPHERYQTAAEFREALLGVCEMLGGRLTQAELRDYMQGRFTAERTREEREIDEALSESRSEPGASGKAVQHETKLLTKPKRVSDRPPPVEVDKTPPPLKKPRAGVGTWLTLAAVVLVAFAVSRLVASPTAVSAAKSDESAAERPNQKPPIAPATPASAAPAAAEAVTPTAPADASPEPAPPTAADTTSSKKHSRPSKRPPAGAPKTVTNQRLQPDRQDPWQ